MKKPTPASAETSAIEASSAVVVAVVAQRERWRAGRFWPAGETKLTGVEVAELGEAGMAAIDADAMFRLVTLVPTAGEP